MSADREWDETLFSGTAAYYRRGRLPYAPGLADVLAGALTLDGRGRLVDVGCGPGIIALGLAHLFGEVVGVDPDAGMLAEAERAAGLAGVAGKTRWARARAEELPAGLGKFTVATFGQSFHWMDQDLVAATVRDMLVSGGGAGAHLGPEDGDPVRRRPAVSGGSPCFDGRAGQAVPGAGPARGPRSAAPRDARRRGGRALQGGLLGPPTSRRPRRPGSGAYV